MANKTIYVRDSDLALWELAQEHLGQQSISALFAEFLREKVETMVQTTNTYVHALRSAPSSPNLMVMFAPVGPTGSGGPGTPNYIHEQELVVFLEGRGVTHSAATKIASQLANSQSVSELTVVRTLHASKSQGMTVAQQVSAFLNAKKPAVFCDECITTSLSLQRHQQAQQVTSAGAASGGFTRVRGTCSNCRKNVIVTHA
jgi:hypothetical protein